jgi:purine-binding chemotaxis protein CheW
MHKSAASPGTETSELSSDGVPVLTFCLAGETFALPVERVHEIIDPVDPTPVPGASAFAPALINVRGVVVPIFDVAGRLGLPPVDTSGENARVIVFDAAGSSPPVHAALPVDAVVQVVSVPEAAIAPIPEMGARWPLQITRGAAATEDGLIVFLDPDTLFGLSSLTREVA